MKNSFIFVLGSVLCLSPMAVYAEHTCPFSKAKTEKEKHECDSKSHGCESEKKSDHGCGMDDGKEMFLKKIDLIFTKQDELNISEEQLETIRDLKNETQKSLIMKDAEIEVNNVDLTSSIWEGELNSEAINGFIDRKFELKKDQAKIILNAFISLRSVLNDEQEDQLKQLCGMRGKARKNTSLNHDENTMNNEQKNMDEAERDSSSQSAAETLREPSNIPRESMTQDETNHMHPTDLDTSNPSTDYDRLNAMPHSGMDMNADSTNMRSGSKTMMAVPEEE